MAKKINRRDFIKTSTAIGVGAALSGKFTPDLVFGGETVDVGVAKGKDYFENTKKAVELIGGIKKYVPKNAKVAILPNPQSSNPGTHTKPEVVRAVIKMCKKAGAKEIGCVTWLKEKYWEGTGIKEVIDAEGVELKITDLKDESLFEPVPIPKGVALKEARILKSFFYYDTFINIPITKEHAGNGFTGTLKNLMGLNSPKSNRTFHRENWKTDLDDIRHLEQSIADLNTVIKPALCVVDATQFITTNGPFGPGKLGKHLKVIAGTDRVAVDSYCAGLLGLKPKDVVAIDKAFGHGLGEMDLGKVNVKEVEV
jgi:uncharacterized protein (DUF362 family)